jgi:hypothetical protein
MLRFDLLPVAASQGSFGERIIYFDFSGARIEIFCQSIFRLGWRFELSWPDVAHEDGRKRL